MKKQQNEELLKTARERFERVRTAETEIRQEAIQDIRFVSGDQWDPALKRDRELAKRPALVFNKLTGPIQQVSNEARENKPAIKVHPIADGADKDTADVLQGIIRHVEYASSADRAYETALEHAVTCGFGYFRFLTDYCDEDSFDQDICIEAISDQLSVYLDPDARKADRSDMQFAFIVQTYSREAYEERWPNAEAKGESFYEGFDGAGDWFGEDGVRVAEYWTVEERSRTLQLLSDGSKRYSTDAEPLPEGVTVEKTRDASERVVKQYIINGLEVLEENEWAGKWIPIVPVYGKEIWVDSKRKLISLVRHSRDPQRLHNYYKTTEAETIALVPRPKWVGYLGQFKSKQKDWQHANLSNAAYLEADPVAINGQVAPLPRWEAFEPPVQALSEAALQSADDIKAATNIFDASLGQRSNEVSGTAINARKVQGDLSNIHFVDNLSRAQVHAGRILLDLIPKIYDTPRQVRIVGDDEQQKVITVNAPYRDEETGKVQTHLITAGKYDVTVSTGPSFQTKRLEAFQTLTDLSKAYPVLVQAAGDLIFRNSDMPGADVIADRLRKLLPPGLQDDQQSDVPPQVQAQMQALSMQNQQLTAAVHQLSSKLESKQAEGQSRIEVALIQARAGVLEAWIKAETDKAKMAFQAELDQIDRQLGILSSARESEMQSQQQQHERMMQSAQFGQDARMQAAQHAQDATMQSAQFGQQTQMAKMQPKPKPTKKAA